MPNEKSDGSYQNVSTFVPTSPEMNFPLPPIFSYNIPQPSLCLHRLWRKKNESSKYQADNSLVPPKNVWIPTSFSATSSQISWCAPPSSLPLSRPCNRHGKCSTPNSLRANRGRLDFHPVGEQIISNSSVAGLSNVLITNKRETIFPTGFEVDLSLLEYPNHLTHLRTKNVEWNNDTPSELSSENPEENDKSVTMSTPALGVGFLAGIPLYRVAEAYLALISNHEKLETRLEHRSLRMTKNQMELLFKRLTSECIGCSSTLVQKIFQSTQKTEQVETIFTINSNRDLSSHRHLEPDCHTVSFLAFFRSLVPTSSLIYCRVRQNVHHIMQSLAICSPAIKSLACIPVSLFNVLPFTAFVENFVTGARIHDWREIVKAFVESTERREILWSGPYVDQDGLFLATLGSRTLFYAFNKVDLSYTQLKKYSGGKAI